MHIDIYMYTYIPISVIICTYIYICAHMDLRRRPCCPIPRKDPTHMYKTHITKIHNEHVQNRALV